MAGSRIEEDLKVVKIDIKSIKPYKGNAKTHDIPEIRKSLRINGMYKPIVVWEKNNTILAGNGTWQAAAEEGWKTIQAVFIDCDEQTAERINVVDNQTTLLGGWNEELLAEQLGKMPDLEGTGFSGQDLEDLLLKLNPPDGEGEGEGEVPDDGYQAQLGVIVMCVDQGQQEFIYEQLKKLADADKSWEDAELKVISI